MTKYIKNEIISQQSNQIQFILLNDSNKIKLAAIGDTDTGKKIAFASYLRKDFVAKSMVIYLDRSNVIASIFFSSDIHGTAEWINGSGLTKSNRWESDDQAKSGSYLARRYTAILSNGSVDDNYAKNTIIPDILDHLESADIAEWVADILQTKEYLVPVDLARFKLN